MPIDKYLLERLDNLMAQHPAPWTTVKMFGGVCYMVDGKMCFGTFKDGLMARVGPDNVEELMQRPGVELMMNGGRIMKGYLSIDPIGYDTDSDLEYWINKCLAFNPEAKASKKR